MTAGKHTIHRVALVAGVEQVVELDDVYSQIKIVCEDQIWIDFNTDTPVTVLTGYSPIWWETFDLKVNRIRLISNDNTPVYIMGLR